MKKMYVKASLNYLGDKDNLDDLNKAYTVVDNAEEATDKLQNCLESFKNAMEQFELMFERNHYDSYNLSVTIDNLDGMLFEFYSDVQSAGLMASDMNPYR